MITLTYKFVFLGAGEINQLLGSFVLVLIIRTLLGGGITVVYSKSYNWENLIVQIQKKSEFSSH